MKKILAFLFSAIYFISNAQNERICHSHEYLKEQLQLHPEMIHQLEEIENQTQNFALSNHDNQNARLANIIKIPVVVHVLYRTTQENISQAQIQSQIDVLNADFRKLNADFSSTVAQFQPIAADMGIEFCLATVDPNSAPTTGVELKSTTKTS